MGYKSKQNFFLRLTDYETGEILIENEIGYFNKQGRSLKLSEAHNGTCIEVNNVTHPHDPRTDVIYTKCLFNNIFRTFKKNQL